MPSEFSTVAATGHVAADHVPRRVQASVRLHRLHTQSGGRARLGFALLVSVCVHGWVGWALIWPQRPPSAESPAAATLEVVLVNAKTPTAPLQPQAVAQHDFDGGGAAPDGLAATPLPRTQAVMSDEQVLLALRQRQAVLEQQQQELLAALANNPHAVQVAPPQPQDDVDADDDDAEDAISRESRLLGARIAALKARIERDNASTARAAAEPAVVRAPYAAYVEAWRARIEALGTAHYPAGARGRIYGSLELSVTLRRDGSVARIEITRPSEHAILNLAARRIVQLAAPFAPLPPELGRDTLTITRTWHFTDQQLDTAP